MKFVERAPLMRDLLERRGRSILDAWPAIERLDRELETVEILAGPTQEGDRIFPIVTKTYSAGTRRPVERGPDGSLPPVLVVRFPVVVQDPEEWSRQCKAWREAHPEDRDNRHTREAHSSVPSPESYPSA
jgi:hypothetical protein